MELKVNSKYEILTPSGFQKFHGIRKLEKPSHVVITLSNGTLIKCSDDHPFMLDGIKIHPNELYIGCKLDSTNNQDILIKSIERIKNNIKLYDVVQVENGNIFNVDGIVSHNCDFITSGHSVVEGAILKWYEETYCCDPIEKRGFDGNYWIWEPADYTKNYIVVADVARGDGGDYSAFHIIDVESLTQVAEYKGKIGTKDYGNMLVNAATEYNDALLVIENSNVGWAAIQPAIDRDYSNLFYTAKDLSVVDVQSQLSKGYDLKDKSQMVPGFSTTSRTRPLIISKLDTMMREKTPIIKSKRLLDELYVFVWKGNRPEAQVGYHDDLVMSFSIGLWVRDTALRLRQEGIELNKRTLGHFGKYQGAYTPGSTRKESGWSMKTKGGDEDLTWLI